MTQRVWSVLHRLRWSSQGRTVVQPVTGHRGRRIRRDSHLGLLVAATVLVGLMVVVLIGSESTDRAATRAQQAVVLNAAYQRAAAGVAAEESLERKYRLQPGPVPRAAHEAAERAVEAALAQVELIGSTTDRGLVSRVRVEHGRYVTASGQLFAAVDRRESGAAINTVDTAQVDPVFGVMQTQIYDAAASHQTAALAEVATTRRTGREVLFLDTVTLLAGTALIAVAGAALTRSRRRLQTQADLNRHQSLHDSLTGLPNRALFQDRTTQALSAAERSGAQVGVMLVDLDRFKDVNDTLGHHYGDLLLTHVARRFADAIRGGDSVARLGGDEFAVLLCDTSADGAVTTARRLADVLAEPFTVHDITLDVEASIGIALVGPGTDVDTALRHADVAMYEAKTQHQPFATYELTRDDNTVARLALLGDLRRAVSRHELILHYQPKITTATGAMHSVEALVRWQHPSRGLLYPDAFIPLAETTAVIHPLTTEILRLALTQARVWLDRGWAIPVAVNISARSLFDATFPAQIHDALAEIGVPPTLLSLELTESAIMADPARALIVLRRLDDLGVGLSIDDFGTGYSSMAYLKDFPVRELKIDRSFVMGMTTDESDVVLVQSAVDLGHNLGLHVVAEGVEDADTQSALAAMGCDLVQGYHIRRPVPATDLDPWLETRGPGVLIGTEREERIGS